MTTHEAERKWMLWIPQTGAKYGAAAFPFAREYLASSRPVRTPELQQKLATILGGPRDARTGWRVVAGRAERFYKPMLTYSFDLLRRTSYAEETLRVVVFPPLHLVQTSTGEAVRVQGILTDLRRPFVFVQPEILSRRGVVFLGRAWPPQGGFLALHMNNFEDEPQVLVGIDQIMEKHG